jgi:proteasome accessory factor B
VERLERLLNLVAALLATERPLTAEEIRERVAGFPTGAGATFHRAFERDKASLRDMGIPLEVIALEPTNPETEWGYRVRAERYELPDPGLEPDEVAALHLAATQVRLEGGDATAAIWKLGGVPEGDATAPPAAGDDVLARAATAAIPGSAHLPDLFAAATEHRRVTFRYRGAERVVDPHRLQFRNGAWYLIGFDHGRSDQRTYRLDRLDGPVASGPPGEFDAPARPGPVATHPWEMGDEEPVEVVVLVDADQAAWAVANAGGRVEELPGGAVHLALQVTNREGLRSWVLGFLDHAEVVSPESERRGLVDWLDGGRWASGGGGEQ